MRIRSLLFVAVGIAATATALVFIVLVQVTRDNTADWEQQADAREVARDLANLLTLTNEFSIYGGERAAMQWTRRHAQLRRTIERAVEREAPGTPLAELPQSLDNLPPLFNRLVELDAEPASPLRERRKELLVERLLSETQELAETRHRWALAVAERQVLNQQRFNTIVLGAPALLLLVVLALALLLGRRVLEPLARLQAAAGAVRDGDFGARVALAGNDELADTASAFDAMTVSVQQQQIAVRAANRLLEEEVARRGESERRLRAVTDNLPAQIAHIDSAQRYLFCNAAITRLLGVPHDQIVGRGLREVRGDQFYARVAPHIERVLTGVQVEFEVDSTRGGQQRTYHTTFIPDLDTAGTVRGFYAMSFDISERKRAEVRIAAGEERLRNILAHAPDAFVAIDGESRVTEWNAAAEATFGWQRDEVLGRELTSVLIPAQHGAAHTRGMAHFRSSGEGAMLGRRIEVSALRRDGREIPVEMSIAGLRIEGGWGAIAFLHDITERKAADERLRASEAQLRTVMESSPLGIFVADPSGPCRYVNPAWERISGIPAVEGLGEGWQRRLHPDDLPRALAFWRGEDPAQAGSVSEVRYLRPDGEMRWVRRHLGELRDGERLLGRVGMAEDITARRNLDNALRESQQRLKLVMDNLPALIAYIDPDRRYRLINRGYVDWHRRGEEEIVGRRVDDFYRPEQRERWLPELQRALAGETVEFDLHIERHDQMRWLHVVYIPHQDDAGEVMGVYSLGFDVTDLRVAEQQLRATTDELTRSNQELEQFAYVASHDLQEPLRMVTSYAQLLQRRHGARFDGEAAEFLGFMTDGARRAQALIADLLQLARVNSQAKPLAAVPLAEAVGDAALALRVAIGESGGQLTHDDALPVVLADRRQLGQLLQNLIGNALKFRGTEPPRVHVGAQRDADTGRWRIEVSDNGIGIDAQFHERVFVLFQRLHLRDEYAGTGIGLAICKKVVERHGGRIGVESAPGRGSTFWFTLADGAADTAATQAAGQGATT